MLSALVCSPTFAGTNDSILELDSGSVIGSDVGKDNVVVKPNHETVANVDSLSHLKVHFTDSLKQSRKHERRKHALIGGIIASGAATVYAILFYELVRSIQPGSIG